MYRFACQILSWSLLFSIPLTSSIEVQLSDAMTPDKQTCRICQELRKENLVETEESLSEQFEEDRKDIHAALKEMENTLKEIDGKVWWLPKTNVMQIHNDSQSIRDDVAKKTLSLNEIESKTGDVRVKIEVYEAEKETNKAKVLEHWGVLYTIRQRIYNLEKVLLDVVVLAEDLATIAHMDKLRIMADTIAKKLKEVMDYYDESNRTMQLVHSSLHEIAVKKVELQTKKIGNKKKCAFLFFFCD